MPCLQISPSSNIHHELNMTNTKWLSSYPRLVVKPDQLIKRRGKKGLLALNVDLQQAHLWIDKYRGVEVEVRTM